MTMKAMSKNEIRFMVSCVLSVMLVCMVPMVLAFAEGGVSYLSPTVSDGTVTFTTETTGFATEITTDSTSLSEGWYVVNGEVTIEDRITVTGDVHLILADGATLNANAGITVEGENSLTIYAQSTGNEMGKLVATAAFISASGSSNAGIGGTAGNSAGTITINGGDITATGGGVSGQYSGTGAGIGGGAAGSGGFITINGGTITATGGAVSWNCSGTGAGIGGGGAYNDNAGAGGNVTIRGGTVTATGGTSRDINDGTGAGIGGGGSYKGSAGAGGTIIIYNGDVAATGGAASGNYSSSGAGIGGGGGAYYSSAGAGGTIIIYNGNVTATGGTASGSYSGSGAGIGGSGGAYVSSAGAGGNVTISGGTVTASGGSGAYCGAAIGSGRKYNTTLSVSGTVTIASGMGYGTSATSVAAITAYTISTGSEISSFSTDRYAKALEVNWSITTQPTGGTYTYGETALLTVAVTNGTTGITYQWYSCSSDGSNAAKIDGATSASYSTTSLDAGTYYYYCAVSEAAASITVNSNIATLTITQVTNAVTAPTMSDWTYGDTPNTPTSTVTDPNGVVYYRYSTSETGTYDIEVLTSATDAGTYWLKAVVDETTNYTSAESTAVSFTIAARTVTANNWTITLDSAYNYVYDGTVKTPSVVSITDDLDNTIDASEYTVGYSENIAVGTATVTITDATGGNYNVSGSTTFTIAQSDTSFGEDAFDGVNDKVYTYGETVTITITPEATGTAAVMMMSLYDTAPTTNQMALFAADGTQLCAAVSANEDGSSYTLTYKTTDKLLAVGEHTITAKYVGNDNMASYNETFDIKIIAKPVTAKVTTNPITKEYDTDTTATVAWEIAAGDLADSSDEITVTATATYASTDVAEGIAINFGTSTTSGAQASYYDVTLASGITGAITTRTVTSDDITITLDTTSYTYDGTAKTPNVVSIVDNTYGNTIDASEYTVTYSNNTNAGTAAVAITDVDGGNYAVSGSTTFIIVEVVADTSTTATVTVWYTVTLSTSGGGTLASELSGFSTVTMKEGASYTFNISPDSGYAISAVYVDGVNVGAVSSYTIDSIASNRSIHVDFVSTSANTEDDATEDEAEEDAQDVEGDTTTTEAADTTDSAATADADAGDANDADDTDDAEPTEVAASESDNNSGSALPIVGGVVATTAALGGGGGYFLFKRKIWFGGGD